MTSKKFLKGISPGAPKSVTGALLADQPGDLQAMIFKTVSEAIQPLVSQIKSLENRMDTFQNEIANVKQLAAKTEMTLSKTQEKVKENESKTAAVGKKQKILEDQMISLQMDRSQKVLRFQNIPEKEGGNLKETMSDLLAPLVKMQKEEFLSATEMVFRTTSVFIRKNALPREVFMRLTSKKMRDMILQKANEQTLKIDQQELKVLKDVPFLARQRRKKYKKLTSLLIKNKIIFRWLIPEGILFKYKGQAVRITTEEKLKDFVLKHGGDLEKQQEQTTKKQTIDTNKEEGEMEEEEEEEDDLRGPMAAFGRVITRAQRLRETDK